MVTDCQILCKSAVKSIGLDLPHFFYLFSLILCVYFPSYPFFSFVMLRRRGWKCSGNRKLGRRCGLTNFQYSTNSSLHNDWELLFAAASNNFTKNISHILYPLPCIVVRALKTLICKWYLTKIYSVKRRFTHLCHQFFVMHLFGFLNNCN